METSLQHSSGPHRGLTNTLRVFLPFGAGYFLSYLYRVVNAVIAPDLITDLGIGPAALGLLTGAYFITFASFQLPLGVLLDRFGPRKVEFLLLLFAGLGALLFSRADSLAGLILGRGLIGFGVSACLMAAFKAYSQWFDRSLWPLVNGLQMAAGGLGALCATAPVETLLVVTDWRTIFFGLGLATFLVAAMVLLVVPERKTPSTGQSIGAQIRGIRDVFTSRTFWQLAPLTTMSQASYLAIQGLWAGPWLRNVAGLDRADSADILFWMAGAMIGGFLVLGTLATRLQQRGINVAHTAVAGMSIFIVAQLLIIVSPVSWAWSTWLLFGFFGTSGIISYSALSQTFPPELSGRVTTAINLLVFIAAFCCQWALGVIIDVAAKFLSPLPAFGYNCGFALLLILEVAGLLCYLLLSPPPKKAHTD